MGIGTVGQLNVLNRKVEVERCAFADDTLDVDPPPHFVHDFLRGGQTDPRTAVALARFKSVEDSFERIRGDAFSVVAD